MGGWTVLEYAIAHPAKVKALVLSSTSGTLDRRGCDPSGGAVYDAWAKDAEAKTAAGLANGIHPAMGMAAAARSPALHLLYASIDTMAGALDKAKVREGLRRTARRTVTELKDFRVPTLLIAGGEDVVFPAFLGKRHRGSLALRRSTPDPPRRPLAIFRGGGYVQLGWSRRFWRASAEEETCRRTIRGLPF